MHKDLIKKGFICIQGNKPEHLFDDYLSCKTSIRYTWKNIPLPEMEIKFAKDDLDYEQLSNRVKLPLTGLNVWFSTIDATIAFK